MTFSGALIPRLPVVARPYQCKTGPGIPGLPACQTLRCVPKVAAIRAAKIIQQVDATAGHEGNTDEGDDSDQQVELELAGLLKGQPSPAHKFVRKQGHCYGCGVKLQIQAVEAPGFVAPEKYAVKQHHKQLDQVLCARCTALSNGAMIPAVEDFAQRIKARAWAASVERTSTDATELQDGPSPAPLADNKKLVSPEELRAQLLEVRERRCVVVLLLDLLDVQGSLLGTLRDIVGRNPVLLVGTKLDLLPAEAHPKAVTQWLMEAAERRKLTVVSAHLVSSRTHDGIPAVAARIRAERKGRDVYVMGAANVGKSAFVRALLREMASFESASFDPAAAGNGRYLPVESAMPGTTLGIIPLQAFATGGTLYDTPGVHLHHRLIHMLPPEELRLLHPRKKLKPAVPPTPAQLSPQTPARAAAGTKAPPAEVSASYVWSDLVRLDVVGGPASAALAFYGPSSMRVVASRLLPVPSTSDEGEPAMGEGAAGAAAAAAAAANGSRGVLNCAASVSARGGLVPHGLEVPADGRHTALADIAVSGLPGWATIWAPNCKTNIRLCVWAPKGVEVFLRPPLPCPTPPEVLEDDPRRLAPPQETAAGTAEAEEAAEAYMKELDQELRRGGMEVVKEGRSGVRKPRAVVAELPVRGRAWAPADPEPPEVSAPEEGWVRISGQVAIHGDEAGPRPRLSRADRGEGPRGPRGAPAGRQQSQQESGADWEATPAGSRSRPGAAARGPSTAQHDGAEAWRSTAQHDSTEGVRVEGRSPREVREGGAPDGDRTPAMPPRRAATNPTERARGEDRRPAPERSAAAPPGDWGTDKTPAPLRSTAQRKDAEADMRGGPRQVSAARSSERPPRQHRGEGDVPSRSGRSAEGSATSRPPVKRSAPPAYSPRRRLLPDAEVRTEAWGEVPAGQTAEPQSPGAEFDIGGLVAKFQREAAGGREGEGATEPKAARKKRVVQESVAIDDLGSLLADSGFQVVKK